MFIMENPIKIDYLGGTPMLGNLYFLWVRDFEPSCGPSCRGGIVFLHLKITCHDATQVPELFPWNQQLWCLQELSYAATRTRHVVPWILRILRYPAMKPQRGFSCLLFVQKSLRKEMDIR